MRYKNWTTREYTFHGVTFGPGDIQEVDASINRKGFVKLPDLSPDVKLEKSNTKTSETSKTPDKAENTPKQPMKYKKTEKTNLSNKSKDSTLESKDEKDGKDQIDKEEKISTESSIWLNFQTLYSLIYFTIYKTLVCCNK